MSLKLIDEQIIPLWPNQAPFSRGDGTDDIPTLTVHLPQGKPTGSAMIVCPGGGYGALAEHEGAPIGRWLNSVGITAFVLRYRLPARGYIHPAPLIDAQRSVRTVRAHAQAWGLDSNRVGILGFSAGGHLTATLSTHFDEKFLDGTDAIDRESARPDVSVLLYPVITLGDVSTHTGSRANLLGKTPSKEMLDHLSAEKRVTKNTPPAFLFHTADDQGVPVENSLLYAAALRMANVPFALHVFEHGHHGVGLASDDPVLSAWPGLCASWLKTKGF